MSTRSQPASGNHEPLLDGLVEEVALRERVRARYAGLAELAAAGAKCGCGQPVDCGCGADCCIPGEDDQPGIGAELYTADERDALPEAAVLASHGCGNPTAVAELREGETVLDLGSGGGIDVLLSAKRVGASGKAYGLDMTEEMLALACRNTEEAGARNVEFLKGHIEQIPLPAATVDVVISNCVVNLSVDKPAVFAETFRVLKPGGRIGCSRHHGRGCRGPPHPRAASRARQLRRLHRRRPLPNRVPHRTGRGRLHGGVDELHPPDRRRAALGHHQGHQAKRLNHRDRRDPQGGAPVSESARLLLT